eukprot:2840641-Pleurochrysis_carterae.AAC.1
MSQREGSMVGWDCVIEWLNGAITQGVTYHVAEASAFMKDMDADVALLKNLFITKIGSSWHFATRANTQSMLGITRGTA